MIRLVSACALLVLLAASGCRMCQSYTDCAPVVMNGPYSHVDGRAGSILSGSPMPLPSAVTESIPQPESTEQN
jgi:hypothetical protein